MITNESIVNTVTKGLCRTNHFS
jgi:hypothetical protein